MSWKASANLPANAAGRPKTGSGDARARERSQFFPAMADAMAAQWGGYAADMRENDESGTVAARGDRAAPRQPERTSS